MNESFLFQMKAKTFPYLLLTIICIGNPVLYSQADSGKSGKPARTTQARYSVVRDCQRPLYNLQLRFTPNTIPTDREDSNILELIFGYQDPYNFYRLILSKPSVKQKETVILLRRQGGKEKDIATSTKRLPVESEDFTLLIKRRQSLLSILINSEIFIETIDSSFTGGKVAVRIDKGTPRLYSVKYQPVSDIFFGDDFMRSRGERTLWTTVRGYWRVYFLSRDIQRSPNAFSFRGSPAHSRKNIENRDEDWGMARIGYDFWDNYKASVSVKSISGAVGLAFYYQSDKNYYLFRWEIDSSRETLGKIQLLRVLRGKHEILAEGYLPSKEDQWYRLSVAIFGSRIKTYVDGKQVFDCISPYLSGGGIGLYVDGERGAYFDDVKLQSYRVFDFDNAAAIKRANESESGRWLLADQAQTQRRVALLSCESSSEAKYLLGDPRWKDYVFESYMRFPDRAEMVGLIFNYRDAQDCFILRLGVNMERHDRHLQLVEVGRDGEKVLDETLCNLMPNRWHHIRVNLKREGVAEIYVNGNLELRAVVRNSFGRVGFYALNAKGVAFSLASVSLSEGVEDSARERVVNNQVFANDEYMAGWSSPRGAWSVSGRISRTYWHKGDFYGRYSISIPFAKESAIYLSARTENPETGYQVSVASAGGKVFRYASGTRYLITLARLGKQRKQVKIKTTVMPRRLTVGKDGKYIWVEVDNNEVMSFSDAASLPGTKVGVYAKHWLSAEHIGVVRYNVKDYTFESAPVDWFCLGRWEVTSRFTCDPRWSWFGGSSKGSAVIWHKDDFTGDLTLEFYVAMRMHLDRFPWVARPGDMNAVIAADGKDISSGYSFILSGWGNKWTRILRKGVIVAETDERLIPSNRHERPTDEDFHRRWFYVKIRKLGNKLEYYLDNRLILEYQDPNPLKGTKVGIWTYDNSIMIGRAKISYRSSSKPGRLNLLSRDSKQIPLSRRAMEIAHSSSTIDNEQSAMPQISITSPTHPGIYFDFETGTQGWTNPSGDQGAYLTIDTTTSSQGRASLKLCNVNTGGDFGVEIPLPQSRGRTDWQSYIDPSRVTELAFDYKIPPEAKVNIYLQIAGRLHFIEFTGRSEYDENLRRLGGIENVKADNEWHHATFDLAAAVRRFFPYERRLTIEKLLIGNFHTNTSYKMVGNYLSAGFGGNGAGVSYHLDEFRILTGGGNIAELDWHPATKYLNVQLSYSYTLDRKPESVPDDISEGTNNSNRYDNLQDGQYFFHIKCKLPNSDWGETFHFPIHVNSKPLTVVSIEPAPESKWGGSPIHLSIVPKKGLNLDASSIRLTVNGTQIAAPHSTLNYDWNERVLNVDLSRSSLSFKDREKVNFHLQFTKQLFDEITDWYVVGPFDNGNDEGFDTIYPPETGNQSVNQGYRGADGRTVRWQRVTSRHGKGVDLNKIMHRYRSVAYALAYIDCPNEKYVQFSVGSNDGVKVWVNNKLVWNNHTHRLLKMDEDKFNVNLKKGINKILLKVDQRSGGWGFIVRLAEVFQYSWNYTFSKMLDNIPPSLVEVDGYLVNNTFEKDMGMWDRNGEAVFMYGLKNWVRTDMEYRALLSRDDSTAASGRYSLKFFNPLVGGVFGAVAYKNPFNAGRYPLLAFDYKIGSEVHTDFVIYRRGTVRNLVFTDNDNDLGRLGSIRHVITDNKWHHAEVNLRELLDRQYYHNGMYQIDQIAMGDWAYQGNNEGAVYHIDNFQIIPVLSGKNGIKLSWQAKDISGINGYSYAWTIYSKDKSRTWQNESQDIIKTPDKIVDTTSSEAVFQGVAEGEAYLSIRAEDRAGNWGETTSYKFLVDNTPPEFITPNPRPDTATWMTTIEVPIRDKGGSGLDPSSIILTINGKSYRPGRRGVYLRRDPWTLTCDWSRLLNRRINNGSLIEFTIIAKDFAGNANGPYRWRIVYDRRQR